MNNLKFSFAVLLATVALLAPLLATGLDSPSINSVALAEGPNVPNIVTTVPVGTHPKDVVYNDKTFLILVALFDSTAVAAVDPQNYNVFTHYSQGLHSNQLAMYTFDNLYVTQRDSNSLSLLNGYSLEVIRTAATGQMPWGLVTGANVYVGNFADGTVSVFDNHLDGLKATIPLPGDAPALMSMGPNGKVLVPGWQTGKLYAIDSSTFEVSSPLSVGPGAFAVTVHPETYRVYLTNRLTGHLYILNPDTLAIEKNITLPGNAYAVAVNYKTNHVFVVDAVNDKVYVLDSTTGELITTLPVGHQDADDGGQGIAINYRSNRIYVTNYADGSLTVIQDVSTGPTPTPTVTRTATVPPSDVVMSGVVYDAAVGKSQGIDNAVVQVDFKCFGASIGEHADATGHYSLTIPGGSLHTCGGVTVQSFASGYSSVSLELLEAELRAQPTRDWGLGRVPTPTATPITPSPTGSPTPTETETLEPASPTPTATATAPPPCTVKPNVPALISPATDSSVPGPTVVLDWNAAKCAESYTVIVREDSPIGAVAAKKKLTKTLFTAELEIGKTYCWKVKANNSVGQRASPWWSFTVVP